VGFPSVCRLRWLREFSCCSIKCVTGIECRSYG